MIDKSLIQRVKPGICAIGYLSVPADKYVKDLTKPYLKVVGSGFLVRETTVITNRHVIQGLLSAQSELGFEDDQKILQFVYPRSGGWQQAFCTFKHYGMVTNAALDFGLIEFVRRSETEFEQCQPLTLGNPSAVAVGDAVAALGYPYGTSMLAEDGRVYRFGAVLQQGYVSAIAPFDGHKPDRFLLDIRTAGGMSGCPVLDSASGEVIGVHYAGMEATIAAAPPLTQELLHTLFKVHDKDEETASQDSDRAQQVP